ncbi:MAG TPA: hypothetical protein P5136_01450 [Methanofastidiosum sp.]|nr:hypothetical protein [Methanofastidiosum sp.]
MYIRTAFRRMNCSACGGTIFKNEPCMTTGNESEHGPTICMRCFISANNIIKSKGACPEVKSDQYHYLNINHFLREFTHRNPRCSLCFSEIPKGSYLWLSHYSTKLKFRRGQPVDYEDPDTIDCVCPKCIKEFVMSIPQDVLDNADINLLEFEIKKINPAS